MTAHWGIPDPGTVGKASGNIAAASCDAFSLFDRRISLFLALPLSSLGRLSLQSRLDQIGRQ